MVTVRSRRWKGAVLPRSFYERSPELVAPDLLGKVLVHIRKGERISGRIVETEAYLGALDPASHAFRPRSPYNDVLYGEAGHADVYLIYGLHYCMNVSCLPDGEAGGVLLRAVVPLQGCQTMAELRDVPRESSAKVLTGGPGKTCQAFGITRELNHGTDVTRTDAVLRIEEDGYIAQTVQVTPRIGIRKAVDLPLRFLLAPTLES